jgi:hypothetical protein
MAEPKRAVRSARRERKARVQEDAAVSSSTTRAALPRIPGWLPPVLYGVLTLFVFREFVFSDDMLFGGDTLSLGYMARKFYADALAAGDFPAWNPLILGGTPFLESLAGGDSLYPTSLLLLVMEPYRALGWKLVLHVFLAGLLMFGWVRALWCSRPAALLAGLAYGLAPFLVSFVHPGHDGKLFVTTLAPLLFWASERTFVRPGLLPYVGVAAVVGLVLLTTHFQMAYFLFGGVGAFYLFRVAQVWLGERAVEAPESAAPERPVEDRPVTERRPRAALTHLGLFLLASVAGAGAAGIQLIPAVDYVVQYSRRAATTVRADLQDNVTYSSSFSLHPEELVSYVIPEFAGNNSRGAAWANDTYWGRNFFRDNLGYAGLVVLMLAGLSFFGAPRRGLRFFFAGLGTVALLFALGRHTPVWRLFYVVFPGISLFRAPDQASFLFGFGAITLAAFGMDRALAMSAGKGEHGKGLRYVWIAAGSVAALMLLAATGALLSLWTSVLYPPCEATDLTLCDPDTMLPQQIAALEAARPFIARGALIAAVLAAATAGVVWAGARGLLKPVGVTAVLGLLIALDALRLDGAFVQTIPFQGFGAPDPGIEYLLSRQREEGPFRIAPIDSADDQTVSPAMFGLEMATGHHPNDLGRYRELIGMRGSGGAENLRTGTTLQPDSGGTRIQPGPILRLLGVRYLLVPGLLEGLDPVAETNFARRPQAIYAIDALPRARLVGAAEVVPDDSAAVARILDPSFDPAVTAILPGPPPIELAGGALNGEVTWEERSNDRARLRVVSDRAALLVISDNWFPSWRARVDGGEEMDVLRAYHTLRAVPVPAGEHTVEMYYRSPLLARSLALSLATVALLLGVTAVSLVRSRRRGPAALG